MTRLTVMAAAIVLALGMALPLQPAQAHSTVSMYHTPTHGHYWKMYNLKVCLRIDTGAAADKGNITGDELVGMTVVYHNRDGNWQHWLNDSTKDTLWKDNTANDSTRYAWWCSEKFKEAWVRNGHEAMHAYVGSSKDGNRWTRSVYAHPESHPYEVNMVDHWEVHHQSDPNAPNDGHGDDTGVTHWCFVTGYNKKWTTTRGNIAKWWLHLKAVTGSANCSGI